MAKPRPLVGAQPITADQQLDGRGGRITFWSFTETTGVATAEVQLWDGTSEGGSLVADITLSAGQSTRDFFGPHALPYRVGLFVEVLSGSVNMQVMSLTEDEWGEGCPVEVINLGEIDLTFGQ